MEPKTVAELQAHYAAVKARLYQPVKRVDPYYQRRADHTVRVGNVTRANFGRPLTPEQREQAVATEQDWGPAMDAELSAAWFRVCPTIPGFAAAEAIHKQIILRSAREFMISVEDLIGEKRTAWIVRARHITMVRLHVTGRYSTAEIGRRFRRDHTTVIHAIRKYERGKLCTRTELALRPL